MKITQEMINKVNNKFRRYNVVSDFHCDKEPTFFNCKGCKYFFRRQQYQTSECLKAMIGDWALYHMEVGNGNDNR